MTKEQIEQKAEVFADSLSDGLYYNSKYHQCRKYGFIQGANWALSHQWISEENYDDVKAHWKEVAKAILVAESGIVDELKALKTNMENEGKSVTEIADAYLDRIVEEILKKSKEEK